MAVVGSASELQGSPSALWTEQGKRYTREFVIQVDSANDGPDVVITAAGLPQLKDRYNFGGINDKARVINHRFRRAMGTCFWYCTVEYETPQVDNQGQEEGGEALGPLFDLPNIELSFSIDKAPGYFTNEEDGEFQKPQDVVRNSAGEIYEPAPEREFSTFLLTITKNRAIDFDPVSINLLYAQKVNFGEFFSLASGMWKFNGCSARNAIREVPISAGTSVTEKYLIVTYHFAGRVEGWNPSLPDIGSYYCDGQKRIPFLDAAGNRYRGLLNGSGGKLDSSAQPGECDDQELEAFILPEVQLYPDFNFAFLNVPTSFEEGRFVLQIPGQGN